MTTAAHTPDHRFAADRIAGATDEQLLAWAEEANYAAYGILHCDKAAWSEAAERCSAERLARAYPR